MAAREGRRRQLTEEQIRKLCELRAKGYQPSVLAERYGVSAKTVQRLAKEVTP